MDIYRISNDFKNFKAPTIEVELLIDKIPKHIEDTAAFNFSYYNLSLTENWQPIPADFSQFNDQDQVVPDICTWDGATLILSHHAYATVGSLILPFGEFLPVNYKSEYFFIFNCRTFGGIAAEPDCLQDRWVGRDHMVFDMTDISNKTIFKTTYDNCQSCYCGGILKNAIEMAGLKGVYFESNLS